MATTFLILSDTYDDAFPGPASLPDKVDVVLQFGACIWRIGRWGLRLRDPDRSHRGASKNTRSG
ncbi:hypothetical protein B0T26DRAFT_755103 [Lasiosphaeria miniovina]|uniref:Uncharacterized protein n=1 Tax=Lasiosphaeria miniovina TaxID=1954250 RepID=A0AA40A6C7_9PEZI|nr:uncharacterized protein B0T26DRAFT_755103 [Lasiosphaeria miniovina]KAK0709981.1 hypothetical protein B0T26DRAFT_755103 [Lasiosphaeria miniovina]